MKKAEQIYLVQSSSQDMLVGAKDEASSLKQKERGSTVERISLTGCLAVLSELNDERKHITLIHHDDGEYPLEINSETAKVEYTMYRSDGEEKRDHEPYGDLTLNPVGCILRQARYEAQCIIRYWRYTFFFGSDVPRKLLQDPRKFLQLMEKKKNRERYKVFLIQQTLNYYLDERPHQIIYVNLNLWNDLTKDSNF